MKRKNANELSHENMSPQCTKKKLLKEENAYYFLF